MAISPSFELVVTTAIIHSTIGTLTGCLDSTDTTKMVAIVERTYRTFSIKIGRSFYTIKVFWIKGILFG